MYIFIEIQFLSLSTSAVSLAQPSPAQPTQPAQPSQPSQPPSSLPYTSRGGSGFLWCFLGFLLGSAVRSGPAL